MGATNNNNGSNGRGNNGISATIPVESRKMVQSLREVVNFSEAEIYATLRECDMDPNDAVNCLLSLDPFHEVKSKKEKKKESKDATDTRFRGASNTSFHGSKGVTDRYARSGSIQFSSFDSTVLHNKPAYRKENGEQSYTGPWSSASALPGNSNIRRPPLHSESVATDNNMFTPSAFDGIPSSSQPASGYQSAWLGAPGQVSMADIVKMGMPQNKGSAMPPHEGSYCQLLATSPLEASYPDLYLSNKQTSNVLEIDPDGEDFNEEWAYIEHTPDVNETSNLKVPVVAHLHVPPSSLPFDRVNQHPKAERVGDLSVDYIDAEIRNKNHVVPTYAADKNMQEEDSKGSSLFDNNLYGNVDSYHSHRRVYERNEAKDGVSSVDANIEQLSLEDDNHEASQEEDNGSVIIPDHLQVHAQECLHLSFGSFGSSVVSGVHDSSRPVINNLEETSEAEENSFTGHLDPRNNRYNEDENLKRTDNENIGQRAAANAGTYDAPSVPLSDGTKDEGPGVAQGNQYTIHSAELIDCSNSPQLDNAYYDQRTSTQMQNATPFTSVMQQAYPASLPSTLLGANVNTGRETDLLTSPFSLMQSIPTKYGIPGTSANGQSISMSEVLRLSSISTQAIPQTVPGGSVAMEHALPQQLQVHPYSQPTLPLTNMIGYPLVPQSYAYLPSLFQQTIANNNTYHQSLAAMLSQYRTSASLNGLPQSTAVSGHGFGTSSNIAAGNVPLNLSTASLGSNIGHDDVLGSHYKDSNHLLSLQQNENSAMWMNGLGSRTTSALPANSNYNLQSQHQQQVGYRQGQQSTQLLGANGYPNYYSQMGMQLEAQQASSREIGLGGPQGQSPKQSQQLWPKSY